MHPECSVDLFGFTRVEERKVVTAFARCAEFLGISPSRCVLLRRLKQARTVLRDADRATVSIGKSPAPAALSNWVRFTRAYQIVFGETPLTTLRRVPGSGPTSPIFADPA